MKRMNGIMEYRLELKKDQQIASGLMKLLHCSIEKDERMLVIIQYSVLVVRSGYTGKRNVVVKGSMYKVIKTFVCRGCMNPLTGTGHTSVDIGVNTHLELVQHK